MFTGAQIEIRGGTRAGDFVWLQCPNEDCCSVPFEWMMLPDDPPAPELARSGH